MPRTLLLSVQFHDGRYHGAGDWPPAPARLFQALVAGAAGGHALPQADKEALTWLETLGAPVIAAPIVRDGQGFTNYVPNNDLDAVGGDPGRIGEIRAPKMIRPRLFDAADTLLYAWTFEESDGVATRAQIICAIAERLYQLGRGVDMAWAWAEVLDQNESELRLARHGGVLYHPTQGGAGAALLCPQQGSLASLEGRFRANRERFTKPEAGKKTQQLFSQAPKPRFASIAYNSPPQRFLFDLRQTSPDAAFAPWPFTRTAQLVEILRQAVAERLKHALPEQEALIERVLIGRGATEADKAARVRIVPLPSIGSPNTDPSIRRVLVEIPPNCPIPAVDISWGLSVAAPFDAHDSTTGEVLFEGPRLTPSSGQNMLRHFGIADPEGARLWRTITPAALPQDISRWRINPSRLRESSKQKSGAERKQEEERAAGAVFQALRHVGIGTRVEAIRVQREPFERKGERAEAFALETRFAKERLWHAEIAFAEPVRGPLVIGDGRYLGLGVMVPLRENWRDVIIFVLPAEANIDLAEGPALLHATRRALMALSGEVTGHVPRLFSGHEENGRPAASGQHKHVFLAAHDSGGDGRIDRIVVAAPWVCDRSMQPHRSMRKAFDEVVSRLEAVRAGRLGVIALGQSVSFLGDEPLIGPARVWESLTPYRATRHAGRRKEPEAALVRDLITECTRRSLPKPEVDILEFWAVATGGGLTARVRLRFAVAVRGPLLLGRDSHRGGGFFKLLR